MGVKKDQLVLKGVGEATHLKPRQLAARWGFHFMTLARWRMDGKGPKFIKLGSKVLYPIKEVEAYEKSTMKESTAG